MSILDIGYNCYAKGVGSLTTYAYDSFYKGSIDKAFRDKPILGSIGVIVSRLREQQICNIQKTQAELSIKAIIAYDISALSFNINSALTIITTIGFLLSSNSIIFPIGFGFSCYFINEAIEKKDINAAFKEGRIFANFAKTYQIPFFKSLYIPPNTSSPLSLN